MTYKPIQRIEWEYVKYVCLRCTSLIVSQRYHNAGNVTCYASQTSNKRLQHA